MLSAIVSQKETHHHKNMSLANEEKNGAIYLKRHPTHFSLKLHPIPILDPVFPTAEKQDSGVLVRCGTVTRWITDYPHTDSLPLTSRKTITEPTPLPVSENDTLLLISARSNSSRGSLVRHMDSNKTNRPIVSGLGGLTLEAIYRILTKNMTSIDDLSLETMIGPSNVASYLEWTLDAMRGCVSHDKVALNDDDTVSFVGKDLMYASMIVELVGSCPKNYYALATTTALCSILVSMLEVFQDALLLQNTVQTILTLCCYSSEYVKAFTKQPNIACILVSILRRGRIETSYCFKALDTIMPTRLELLRRLAEKCKHIFDETDLLTQLLALWNCLDKQSYGFVHYQSPDDLRELREERLRCTSKTLNWDAFVLPPVKQLTHSQSSLPHTLNHDTSKTCRKAQSDITWEASKPESQSRAKLCFDPATQRIQNFKYECYNQRQAASCSAAALSRAQMGATDAPLLTEARKASIDSFSSSILDDCSVSSTDSKRCHACTAYYGPSKLSTQRDTMSCLMHLLATICSPEFITNVCKYTLGLRLLCVVVDVRTCDPSIVANAFYVLGMIVGELQDIFYQLQAVELICHILHANYRYDKKWSNEVVGYGCLTIASLCAQHLQNTAIIVEDTRLIQLVVRILNERASFHDDLGIHGASALLCNLLYKNDVAKARFGHFNVCQVLVKTLKSILPPHTPKRYPPVCLFRAIGNVGLCHENCATFIKEGLGVTYAAYLEQCITTAPPSTAEACCKALANLVMDCRHVEGFQTCLDPLMEFLRLECDNAKASEYLYDLYLCAFEALGNLCRNPTASQRFAEKNYIQILLRLLPSLPYSDLLYAKAFYLLRNQVSNPITAAKLVCEGLLELCERIIDNGARRLAKVENNSKQSEDVPDRLPRSFYLLLFSALRCLYRVVVTKGDVKRCVEARCVPALVRLYLANLRSSSLASHTLCVFLRIFHNFSNHSDLSSPSESETTATTTTPRRTPRSTQVSKNGSASVGASPSNQKHSTFESKKKENSLSTLITDTSLAEDENSTFATAFEALQLHQSAWDDMIIATRLYLANKKLFHDLRFCKLALGFLAYLAFPSPSEAFYDSIFDGENNADVSFELAFNDPSRKTVYHTRNAHKTSLGDVQNTQLSSADRETESGKETLNTEMPCIANPFSLVKQIERCFVTHRDIALFEECVYLLNHIVLNAQSPERRRAIMDTPFLHAYKAFLFQNDAALDLGKYSYNLYALVHAYHAGIMLRTSVTFYLTNEALIRPYRCLMAKPFPLQLTGWTAPTFLDGTQGLPDDVKTYLLQGGKLCWVASKAVEGSWKQERGVFYWRASSDLIQLNWSTARRRTLFKKNAFTHQVPIRCCSVITQGFVEDAAHLRDAPYLDTHVVTITYTKHYEHQLAGGIVLGLKNAQDRDALFRILTLWRDAALYGL